MPGACQSRVVTEPQRDSCQRKLTDEVVLRFPRSPGTEQTSGSHLIRVLRTHLPLEGEGLGAPAPL